MEKGIRKGDVMKKWIVVLAFLTLLTACQSQLEEKLTEKAHVQNMPHTENGITVTAEQKVYSTDTEKVVVLVQNDSQEEFSMGTHLFLEKKVDGVWHEFPYDRDHFTEAAIVVLPGESSGVGVSMDELKNELTPGEYRGRISSLAAPFKVE